MIMNSLTKTYLTLAALILVVALLSSCGTTSRAHHRYSQAQDSAPNYHIDVDKIPNATPKVEPLNKHANPTKYTVLGHTYYVRHSYLGYDETGIASWYGMKFHAFKTSSGEMYDVAGMTAANKVLPIPCYATVTNLKNGRQVIVKINDRGPFYQNRIIDLSYAAAVKLKVWPKGTGLVRVQAIDPTHWQPNGSATSVQQVAINGNPRIYMQIGAFRSRANAESLAKRIQQVTDNPIQIKAAELENAPIYKVQIGPLPNVEHSDQLFAALQREHLGTPMTVIK
jgi:rare lipoprotein A